MKILRYVVGVLIALLILGTFAFIILKHQFMARFFSHGQAPVVTISTAPAQMQSWQSYLRSIGTVVAYKGVQVNARLPGQVVAIHFYSGQQVKKGQLLVQLDDALDQQKYQGDLIQLKLDQHNYQRSLILSRTSRGSVAEQDLEAARAKIDQDKLIIGQDKLNISYKKILAPFAGKLGIRQVNIGQYIQAGTAVVSLQQLNRVYADFSVSQSDYPKVKTDQVVQLFLPAYPQQVFTGKIQAISPKLDAATRTVQVRAVFDNSRRLMLPGQFARLRVLLNREKQVITIPSTAAIYSLFGDAVYVVSNKPSVGKVKHDMAILRSVTFGQQRAGRVIVTHGVKSGEQVVIAGQNKLHSGSLVKVVNLSDKN